MEFQATAKYLRVSTRKVRLIADAVKHLSVSQALIQLDTMPKRAGAILKKVVDSAIANAKGKNVEVQSLRIKTIDVMQGSAMKRWHAVSRGMAHAYKKRMTHIRVVLATIEGEKTVQKGAK